MAYFVSEDDLEDFFDTNSGFVDTFKNNIYLGFKIVEVNQG